MSKPEGPETGLEPLKQVALTSDEWDVVHDALLDAEAAAQGSAEDWKGRSREARYQQEALETRRILDKLNAALSVSASWASRAPDGNQIADTCVQQVAELPDRTSPDDWPEAMLVTADELRSIVREAVASQTGVARAPEPAEFCPACGHETFERDELGKENERLRAELASRAPELEPEKEAMAASIQHRLNQQPSMVDYIFLPRDWCEQIVSWLAASPAPKEGDGK